MLLKQFWNDELRHDYLHITKMYHRKYMHYSCEIIFIAYEQKKNPLSIVQLCQ